MVGISAIGLQVDSIFLRFLDFSRSEMLAMCGSCLKFVIYKSLESCWHIAIKKIRAQCAIACSRKKEEKACLINHCLLRIK